MNDQLLPPPPVRAGRAAEVWVDLIDTGEELLRAGFRARGGADAVEQQYQNWCRRELAEHDRRLEHLLDELSRRESAGAR